MLREYCEKKDKLSRFKDPASLPACFIGMPNFVIRMKYFDQRTHKQVKENESNWIKISAIRFECLL